MAKHKPDDLITADGSYDKAAILRDAHRHQYGAMRRTVGVGPVALAFRGRKLEQCVTTPQPAATGEEERAASDGGCRSSRACRR